MSGCPTHGPLVGGYALGALDPGEMDEMRAHVVTCPHCGPEADRLAPLPGLLDQIVPADVPPPTLSPQVEQQVLDRFARERRKRAVAPARFGRRRALALAAAAVAAIAIVLVVVLPLGGGEGESAYASVSLAGSGEAAADAELAVVPAGTSIRLRARGLTAGAEYEVWCVRANGRWVSGGTFWADADGSSEADLTAAVKPGDYHWMAVTAHGRERGARGPVVLRGELRY